MLPARPVAAEGSNFPASIGRGRIELNTDLAFSHARYRGDLAAFALQGPWIASLKLQLSLYNLFNTHANASAYYYTSRVQDEPLAGVDGIQVHPLEPFSGVLKLTAYF